MKNDNTSYFFKTKSRKENHRKTQERNLNKSRPLGLASRKLTRKLKKATLTNRGLWDWLLENSQENTGKKP